MKTIAFYNEKGGVGKSTFSIMYASYLQYVLKVNTTLVDFDLRDADFRRQEINNEQKKIDSEPDEETKRKMTETLNRKKKGSYEIITCQKRDAYEYNKNKMADDVEDVAYVKWMRNVIKEEEENGTQVLVIDLPGSKEARQPTALMASEMVSLVVMPIERDVQVMTAVLWTIEEVLQFLKSHGVDQKAVGFLNRINLSYDKKPSFEKMMRKLMEDYDFKMLPDIITNSPNITALKDFNNVIRSTMNYPEWGGKARSEDPGMDNLFLDVTRILDKSPDMKGTQKTYLYDSYRNMAKKENAASNVRQMKGSSFPELELSWLPDDWNETFKPEFRTKEEVEANIEIIRKRKEEERKARKEAELEKLRDQHMKEMLAEKDKDDTKGEENGKADPELKSGIDDGSDAGENAGNDNGNEGSQEPAGKNGEDKEEKNPADVQEEAPKTDDSGSSGQNPEDGETKAPETPDPKDEGDDGFEEAKPTGVEDENDM